MPVQKQTFATRIAIRTLGVFTCSLVILAAGFLWQDFRRGHTRAYTNIENELAYLVDGFQTRIDDLRDDAIFLSGVPPVQGIVRATDHSGADPLDKSTDKQWRSRLAATFEEAMGNKEYYLQVRFIGIADGGRELVRVERQRGKLLRTPEDRLEQKADEFYFSEIIQMNPRQIYLSPFSINREHGRIVFPKQLVVRAAVPVHGSENKPFGFIIINMAAQHIFSKLPAANQHGYSIHIVDSTGNVLLHADPEDYVVDPNNSVLSDAQVKEFLLSEEYQKQAYQGTVGDQLVVAKKVYNNKENPDQFFGIVISKQKATVSGETWADAKVLLPLLLLLLFANLVGGYFIVRREIAPLEALRKLAQDLVAGNQIEFEKKLVDRGDELAGLADEFQNLAAKVAEKSAMLDTHKQALDETALVSETDLRGRITYVNSLFCKVSGYREDELIGSYHRITNSKHHDAEFFAEMWNTISSGKSWNGEIRNQRKDGSYYWVDTCIVPAKSDSGGISSYIAISHDVTEKKLQETRLVKKTEAKERFFTTMSHEIRTPLGAIIGLNDVLATTELDEKQSSLVSKIASSSNLLLEIINDILDLAKFESGNLDITPHPSKVQEITAGVMETMSEKAREKGIDFNISISSKVPSYVMVDSVRLKQVMLNFISNAIKFTSKGHVTVSVTARKIQIGSNDVELHFVVSDSGIGLTPEQQLLIFQEYKQAESTTTMKFGGTGLGLAICRRIADAMNGRIWVESKYGSGSKFHFSVPCQTSSEGNYESEQEDPSENLLNELVVKETRILLADDHELNRVIFKSLMKAFRLKTEMVENGQQAVDLCKEREFDLIFLDVQMPVMDGMTACKAIRNVYYERDKDQPWIVSLTANVFREDREKCFQVGFSDFLAKPFNRHTLKQILTNYCLKKTTFEEFAGPTESDSDDQDSGKLIPMKKYKS